MRRLVPIGVLLFAMLYAATPADAFHHHHWGRGWGGYRGFGWGGYGYRGLGYRGYGFGGYGGYGLGGYGGYGGYGYGGYGGLGYGGYGGYGYPYYNTGYFPNTYDSSYYPWYGCYNAGGLRSGTTVGLGYPSYGLVSNSYNPAVNYVVTSYPETSSSAAAGPAVWTIKVAPASTAATTAVAANVPSPLALGRFLGIKDLRPVAIGEAPPLIAAKPSSPITQRLGEILVRQSNAEYRGKAERMIAEGDELFRAQNFYSALQRYKLAVSTAPDLTEALWRQAHALIATHQYDLAAATFKRAIARTEDLGRGGFRLSDLYGAATMTKAAHLDSLGEWANSRSNSSDPYFLIGLFLNYDGQMARAEKFFQRASQLAGISGGHIAAFLAPAEETPLAPTPRLAAPAAAPPIIPVSIGVEI
jgi:hypothetical protein